MQRTVDTLVIRVGDDKTQIALTDSAVEAVQDEAAGKLVDAFSGAWEIEQAVPSGRPQTPAVASRLADRNRTSALLSELADAASGHSGRLSDLRVRPAGRERLAHELVPCKAGLFAAAVGSLVAGLGLPEFVGGHALRLLSQSCTWRASTRCQCTG
jgi:hypothetical protein